MVIQNANATTVYVEEFLKITSTATDIAKLVPDISGYITNEGLSNPTKFASSLISEIGNQVSTETTRLNGQTNATLLELSKQNAANAASLLGSIYDDATKKIDNVTPSTAASLYESQKKIQKIAEQLKDVGSSSLESVIAEDKKLQAAVDSESDSDSEPAPDTTTSEEKAQRLTDKLAEKTLEKVAEDENPFAPSNNSSEPNPYYGTERLIFGTSCILGGGRGGYSARTRRDASVGIDNPLFQNPLIWIGTPNPAPPIVETFISPYPMDVPELFRGSIGWMDDYYEVGNCSTNPYSLQKAKTSTRQALALSSGEPVIVLLTLPGEQEVDVLVLLESDAQVEALEDLISDDVDAGVLTTFIETQKIAMLPFTRVAEYYAASMMPEGLSFINDGALRFVVNKRFNKLVGVPYDSQELAIIFADQGRSYFDADGRITVRDGDDQILLSAVIETSGMEASDTGTAGWSWPAEGDESAEDYVLEVSYGGGIKQTLQPFVAAPNFDMAVLERTDLMPITNRATGVVLMEGRLFRPAYTVNPLTSALKAYAKLTAGAEGISFWEKDVNADGVMDYVLLSPEVGSQVLYGL